MENQYAGLCSIPLKETQKLLSQVFSFNDDDETFSAKKLLLSATSEVKVHVLDSRLVNQVLSNNIYCELLARTMLGKTVFPLRRGDIIVHRWSDYGNHPKLIFDGETFVPLDTQFDKRGTVPSSFCFPEFPFGYWDQIIEHNSIHHLRWELIYSQVPETFESHHFNDELYLSFFLSFEKEKYRFLFHPSRSILSSGLATVSYRRGVFGEHSLLILV